MVRNMAASMKMKMELQMKLFSIKIPKTHVFR